MHWVSRRESLAELTVDRDLLQNSPPINSDIIIVGIKVLRHQLRNVDHGLLNLIGLHTNQTSPNIPEGRLEQLYVHCWGTEWRKVFWRLRDTYEMIPSLNTLIALTSAYLDTRLLAEPLPWALPTSGSMTFQASLKRVSNTMGRCCQGSH